MTRLIFQFVPDSHIVSQDGEPNWDSDYVEKIDTEKELTIIHLCDGTQIEYDNVGNVRFSFDISEITKDKLDELFEISRHKMDMACERATQSYTVCLVLNSEDVSSIYLNNLDEITEFGEEEFNSPDLEYTEFGSQIIKISFRDRNNCITV